MAELRRCDGKGPARGDQVGANPTDRAKNGTKRGVLTEADGGPLAVVVRGANVHDSLLLQDAPEAVIVEPPDPREHEQHLCLDKAFSGAPSDVTARVFGYGAIEQIYRWAASTDARIKAARPDDTFIGQIKRVAKQLGWRA